MSFFWLKKSNFLTFFRLDLNKSRLKFKKKWAGIKYFGLELIFFWKISVFKSFFLLKKSNFLTFFRLELKKFGLEFKKMGWN